MGFKHVGRVHSISFAQRVLILWKVCNAKCVPTSCLPPVKADSLLGAQKIYTPPVCLELGYFKIATCHSEWPSWSHPKKVSRLSSPVFVRIHVVQSIHSIKFQRFNNWGLRAWALPMFCLFCRIILLFEVSSWFRKYTVCENPERCWNCYSILCNPRWWSHRPIISSKLLEQPAQTLVRFLPWLYSEVVLGR